MEGVGGGVEILRGVNGWSELVSLLCSAGSFTAWILPSFPRAELRRVRLEDLPERPGGLWHAFEAVAPHSTLLCFGCMG